MKKALLFLSLFCFIFSNAQETSPSTVDGISVSPSSIILSIVPGKSEVKNVRVSNSTKNTFKFKISFTDFIMDANGKPIEVKADKSKYALSKWVVASPSFFELVGGQSIQINVRIDIPPTDSAAHACWTILIIDKVTERQAVPENSSATTIALGIIPSFAFGVYIYQNPPNVIKTKRR